MFLFGSYSDSLVTNATTYKIYFLLSIPLHCTLDLIWYLQHYNMDSDIQKHCLAAVVLHIVLLRKIRFRLSYFCVISYVLHSHKCFKEGKADNSLQENCKEELARYTNASVSSVCSLPWLFKVIFNIIKIIFLF